MALRVLARFAGSAGPGPLPTFGLPHFVLALLIVGAMHGIGRQGLAEQLHLGEGAVRTLLARLRRSKLIRVSVIGCELTKQGSEAYAEVRARLPFLGAIEAGPLSLGRFSAAVVVREATREIGFGIEQRDAAVRAGARGATTMRYREGKFQLPRGSQDCARDYPDPLWERLRRDLNLHDGDIVIAVGADSRVAAQYGALAAALSLL